LGDGDRLCCLYRELCSDDKSQPITSVLALSDTCSSKGEESESLLMLYVFQPQFATLPNYTGDTFKFGQLYILPCN